MVSYDDVTQGAMAHKLLKKINGLAMQIILTKVILMPWPWNIQRNLTLHFGICDKYMINIEQQ